MRRLIYVLIMFLVIACNNQKHNDCNKELKYFKNCNYSECKIPIVEKHLEDTCVLFIVDTGANLSIIDQSFYNQHTRLFKYLKQEEITYSGIGGQQTRTTDVLLADFQTDSQVFTTSDLSAVRDRLNSQGFKIIGILGSDYLSRYSMVIDYKNRVMYPSYYNLDSLKLN